MRKRLVSLLLAACLLAAACAMPVTAATEDEAVRVVKALEIMVGDENGDMMLGSNVTRAQFAKLLVASSKFKDGVGADGAGYSLYSDVKSSYWASEYIRLAAEQGWMIGYTDGSFKPDGTITLEEACTAALRLLGYDSATLAGSYPYAQLNKASALGLRDGIAKQRGERMLRRDCAMLFYNTLIADTSAGQVYAATLGYALTADGEIDYAAVLRDKLSGPYIAGAGETLPFTPETVYRDGKPSGSAALQRYDVYYYNAGVRTVWIYTERVSGKVSLDSDTAPTMATVAGKTYAIGSAEARYQLSALGGGSGDDYVTLLLGMDGAVVGVLTGDAVEASYYGVVTAAGKSAQDEGDGAAVYATVTVFCTDGAARTFMTARNAVYNAGRLVRVSVTDGAVDITGLSPKRLSGRVSAAATWLGDYALAEDVNIIDISSEGDAAAVEPKRLAGVSLNEDDVRFYSIDTAGKIDNLILDDVTGDTWTYVYMSSIEDYSTETSINVTYHYYENGALKTLRSTSTMYAVATGGVALRYNADGSVKTMRQLASARLTALGGQSAMADNRRYTIADGAAVYLRKDGTYYQTELSSIDATDYRVTGWYDGFGRPAGGLVRLVIAERIAAQAED